MDTLINQLFALTIFDDIRQFIAAINVLTTLGLSATVAGIGLCRMNAIKMKLVQYRYVAPTILGTVLAIVVFFSTLGEDQPDYYMPLALAGYLIYMLNNRAEWKAGVPLYMLRGVAVVKNERWSGNIMQRLKFQNVAVSVSVGAAIVVSTATAMEGRGDPLQIFAAYADPRVVTSNGDLDIVYDFRRTRPCAGAVDRSVLRAGTEQPVQRFASTPLASTKIGVRLEGVRVKLQLDNLAPGNYIYRAVVTSYCDDRAAPYIKVTPDIPFIVAPDPLQ